MAKLKTVYVCRECGNNQPRWVGRCPQCEAWNSMEEQGQKAAEIKRRVGVDDAMKPVSLLDIPLDRGGELRVRTGLGELDEVLGGGLVAGSVVLIGGDPGVGKSTLLLMALDRFAARGLTVLYVSGEESARQIRLRAERLGIATPMLLLAQTDFSAVEAVINDSKPTVVVIDSVQTVHIPELDSLPGSVSQIREVAHKAMVLAKTTGTAIFLVGHVTKSGELAGPKVLEHLVDTVLYFEGDGRSSLRILRSVKNRFGASGELGVFEMVDEGLVEVPDASARLLAERDESAAGTAVIAAMEGSRPLLVEVQALVGRPTQQQMPARTCVGVDRTRVQMLAAVLEKNGIQLHDRDIFVNAAGGVRLVEPAIDLGLVAAIASSFTDRPVPPHTLLLGEVGLVGEVRAIGHPVPRMREAARHGFRRALVPTSVKEGPPGLQLVPVRTVKEALHALFRGGDH
jgi:DNA repair protein RadA/Sms